MTITPDAVVMPAGYLPHSLAAPRYGWMLTLDMHECDPLLIEDGTVLRTWVRDLVTKIGMTAFGVPIVRHFGHGDPVTSGYTVIQLIETSSITAHFSPHLRTAHIDVFSCKLFDPITVIAHTEQRLGGHGGFASFTPRG